MLIYFMRGSLPWQDLSAGNRADKFKKIMESKINTPVDELCKGFDGKEMLPDKIRRV